MRSRSRRAGSKQRLSRTLDRQRAVEVGTPERGACGLRMEAHRGEGVEVGRRLRHHQSGRLSSQTVASAFGAVLREDRGAAQLLALPGEERKRFFRPGRLGEQSGTAGGGDGELSPPRVPPRATRFSPIPYSGPMPGRRGSHRGQAGAILSVIIVHTFIRSERREHRCLALSRRTIREVVLSTSLAARSSC